MKHPHIIQHHIIHRLEQPRFSRLLAAILCSAITTLGLITSAIAKDEISPPEIVQGLLPSLDDDLMAIHLSFPATTNNNRLFPQADLSAVMAQRIKDFVTNDRALGFRATPQPPSRKALYLNRYQLADMRVVDAIIAAKEAGVQNIVINSDGSSYFTGVFAEGEKHHSDFLKRARWRDNVGAACIQKLLAHGFRLNEAGPYQINLSPLQNPHLIMIGDIFHLKHDVFAVYGDDAHRQLVDSLVEEGSNNPVTDEAGRPNPRINVMVAHREPRMADYMIERAKAQAANAQAGGLIADIAPRAPLQIIYNSTVAAFPQNPEAPWTTPSIVVAYTDGRENPNRLLADALFTAAGKSSDGKRDLTEEEKAKTPSVAVSSAHLFHFAWTYARATSALQAAMEAQPPMKLVIGVDGKFADPSDFGEPTRWAGFPTIPSYGFARFQMPKALRNRAIMKVFQSANPHAVDINPEGAPTGRNVMHLKYSAIFYGVNGQLMVRIHAGSFNLSSHEENAETAVVITAPQDDPAGRLLSDLDAAVLNFFQTDPDWIEPRVAVNRAVLENIMERSLLYIPIPFVEELWSLGSIHTHDHRDHIEEASQKIVALASTPSPAKKSIDPTLVDRVQQRMTLLKDFQTWHSQQTWYQNEPDRYSVLSPLRFPLFLGLALRLQDRTLNLTTIKRLLEILIGDYKADSAENERRIAAGWKALGLTQPVPISKEKQPTPAAMIAPPPLEARRAAARESADKRGIESNACGDLIKLL